MPLQRQPEGLARRAAAATSPASRRPRSTASADSGGLSMPTQPRFQPGRATAGVEERLVGADPARHPRDPSRAHRRRERVEVGGSTASGRRGRAARGRRARSGLRERPRRAPPSWKRNDAPSRARAAYATGSFAFDAGTNGEDALCANRTRPVRRSIGVRRSATRREPLPTQRSGQVGAQRRRRGGRRERQRERRPGRRR